MIKKISKKSTLTRKNDEIYHRNEPLTIFKLFIFIHQELLSKKKKTIKRASGDEKNLYCDFVQPKHKEILQAILQGHWMFIPAE